jgi:hypothetical protein
VTKDKNERRWHRRGFQWCRVINADRRSLFVQNCSVVYRVEGINHANH